MDTSSLPGTFKDEDKREISNPSQTTSIVEPLNLGEIYAFQLNYMTGTGMVFSARDAYVWPSTRAGGAGSQAGERVATFPLNYPLSNRTYSYVFCEETFPDGREADWMNFIAHAFSQWTLATDELVVIERLDAECADYSQFVEPIVTQVAAFAGTILPVGRLPTAKEVLMHTEGLLGSFHDSGIKTTRSEDASLSEVFMINDSGVPLPPRVFEEISNEVGHGWCSFACAVPNDTGPEPTADIKLRESKFASVSMAVPQTGVGLHVPGVDSNADVGELPFNACRPEVVHEYGVLVHEAGHALGITHGRGGMDQERHHSNLADSVMSYSVNPDYSCSPHPLDIMAIYALYQTVPRVSISGPTSEREFETVLFTVDISKMTAPYRYEWSAAPWNLAFSSNNAFISFALPDVSESDSVEDRRITIAVRVTDVGGEVAQDRHVITVKP